MVFQRTRKEETVEIWDLVRKWHQGKPEEGIRKVAANIQVVGGEDDAAIVFGNRNNTLVRLWKHPDGQLETESSYPDKPAFRNFRMPPVNEENSAQVICQPVWDLVKTLTDETIAQFIRRNFSPPLKGPVPPSLEENMVVRIRQFVSQTSGRQRNVRNLAREFQERILQMSEPGALQLITQIVWEIPRHDAWDPSPFPRNKSITLWHYNTVIQLGEHAQQLWESNPGIMTWYMLHPEDEDHQSEPANHPGQLVQKAREHLLELGLDPKNWRFISRLGPETIREFAWAEYPELSAWMMNIMAEVRTAPEPEVIRWAPNLCRGMQFPPQRMEAENFARAVRLMFRESEAHPGEHERIIQQAENLRDYVNGMSQEGNRIESNAWNGIIQRSERWHRDLQEHLERRRRENLINREEGHLEWNSLVETMENDDFTIVPLTNELQLLEEAAEMQHCVSGYGNTCAGGGSRIFAIFEGKDHVATMEIQKQQNRWAPAQIRGHHNHPVSNAVSQASKWAADMYDLAWQENPEHTSWRVKTPAKAE